MTISTAPISPARRRRASAAKFGSKRRLKPTMSGLRRSPQRPPGSRGSAPRRGRPASRRRPPCRPARHARSGRHGVSVGVQITTASMSRSLDDRVDGRATMRAGRRGERLRRRRASRRRRREPGARVGGDVGAVDAADPPGAEKPNPQHFPARILPIPVPYSHNPTGCRPEGLRERLIQVDRQANYNFIGARAQTPVQALMSDVPTRQLGGKVAVVTGGTQGLGEAIARLFAERGAAGLVICGRNADKGEAVAADLTAQGCRTVFVQADLADVDDAARRRRGGRPAPSAASTRSSTPPASPTAARSSTPRRSSSTAWWR